MQHKGFLLGATVGMLPAMPQRFAVQMRGMLVISKMLTNSYGWNIDCRSLLLLVVPCSRSTSTLVIASSVLQSRFVLSATQSAYKSLTICPLLQVVTLVIAANIAQHGSVRM